MRLSSSQHLIFPPLQWLRLYELLKEGEMECRYVGLRSAIRTALANCMVRLKHKKAFEEPDYTAGIVMSISDALNSSNQR